MQEQQQQHESASLALAAAQEDVHRLSSGKNQADAVQSELAALKSAHEALQGELAVAKGRLSGFDDSCQLSLNKVQSLSAALQEAQQAKVEPPSSCLTVLCVTPSFLSSSPLPLPGLSACPCSLIKHVTFSTSSALAHTTLLSNSTTHLCHSLCHPHIAPLPPPPPPFLLVAHLRCQAPQAVCGQCS